MNVSLLPLFDAHHLVTVMTSLLMLVVGILAIYGCRQLLFTVNRLTGVQRHPYIDIGIARWPVIEVLITSHNDKIMLTRCIDSLLKTDYPLHQLKITICTDDSSNATGQIIDSYAKRFPGKISSLQITRGLVEKSVALKEFWLCAKGDIVIMFDAKDVPGRGLLKQLVTPFFDPEIGAVMGRVVPVNSSASLMGRLMDLERSANFQVSLQAQTNMNLLPQYEGTVSGVRLSAVVAVGGWHGDALAADADINLRLMLNRWKTAYTNRAECYQVISQDWSERVKQGTRRVKENNQLMTRYWWPLATCSHLTLGQRINALLNLFSFLMPLLVLIGWGLILGLYFFDARFLLSKIIPVYVLMSLGVLGNFVAFFEMMMAVLLDGNRRRIRLLPFNLLESSVTLLIHPVALCRLWLQSAFSWTQGQRKTSHVSRSVSK